MSGDPQPDGVSVSMKDLGKDFVSGDGQRVAALRGVTCSIESGEFVSIIGPSGCGKSTLLKILAGLTRPTWGVAHIAGQPIDRPSQENGFMLQSPTLLPWRTATENVMLPIEIVRPREAKKYRSKATHLLKLAGLEGFESALPKELSGGMQQRVAMARVLMTDPRLLLLDEPFGALDELTREQMDQELLKIWRGTQKTVLLVTHSLNESVFLSDRIVVMSERPGTIVGEVRVDLARPRDASVLHTEAFHHALLEVRALLNARKVWSDVHG